MAYTTIRDPGIAKGFSVLANVLGRPSANSAIEADLNRTKRDAIVAQTEIDRQKLAAMREQQANQVLLSSILAGNPDLTDPAARADMMSAIAGTENGMQYGPKFATGATTFINPNTYNEQDFSNVLLGTGVVNSYGDTPTGQGRALEQDTSKYQSGLANALTMNNQDNQTAISNNRMDNDGAMARLIWETQHPNGSTSRTGTALDVSPDDTSNLWDIAQERILAQFPDTEAIDPEVQAALMPRISQVYQQTRNAEIAIQQVLSEIGLEGYAKDESWLPTGDTQRLKLKAPAGGLPSADNPGAAAAPTAASGTPPKIVEGQSATNPKTGQKIVFKNGQWVPAGTTVPTGY